MIRYTKARAFALVPLMLAQPAFAEDEAAPANPPQDEIVVTSVPLHPAAGLMNEHTHDGGEFMLALRYAHNRYSGANQSGTSAISDAAIHAAGYTARATRMDMDMVMLDIMYAPTDRVTLMAMPHWMRHEMTMMGIDPSNTGMDMGGGMGGMGGTDMGHAHGGMPYGATMTHSTKGFGDTLVSASYRLANRPELKVHATLGLWVPTGKVDRKNANGSFVHYGMQSGSGTWDIEPSITVASEKGVVGWGAQASYRWRSERRNDSGFSFGDRAMATAWASYLVSSQLSLTGRMAWEHEGAIQGHYNGPHSHSSPADRQANYGGDTVLAALGLNLGLPVGGKDRTQLGVEFGVPLYQNLNGIQLPEDWRLSVSLGKAF